MNYSLHSLGMTNFYQLIAEHFGEGTLGVLSCWINCMDTDGSGQLTEGEFVETCETLGYKGDAKQLFYWLTPEPSKPFLSLEDVSLDAAAALQRGDADIYGIRLI